MHKVWVYRGLPVGFLLFWYSVLFTVESLSLLYLLLISWFICSRRWCIDKLGVFHANRISMCLDSHLNKGWRWRRETGLSHPVKYFTDRSKVVILMWIFYGFFLPCVCYALCASVDMCLVLTCWERAYLLALVCGVQLWVCHFSIVSWVRCDTLLYRFLIFAPLLTLIIDDAAC